MRRLASLGCKVALGLVLSVGIYCVIIIMMNIYSEGATQIHEMLTSYIITSLLCWVIVGEIITHVIFSAKNNYELVNDVKEYWIVELLQYFFYLMRCKSYFIFKLSIFLALVGMTLILLTPFMESQIFIIKSYIPILDNFIFMLGIAAIITAILMISIVLLIGGNWIAQSLSIMILTIFTSLIYSYHELKLIIIKYPIDLLFFYNNLFWSAAHLLQFLYNQILIIGWICLMQLCIMNNYQSQSFDKVVYKLLLVANNFLAVIMLSGHYLYSMEHPRFLLFFYNYIKYFANIIPIFAIIVILYQLFSQFQSRQFKLSCNYIVIILISCTCFILNLIFQYHNLYPDLSNIVLYDYSGVIINLSIVLVTLIYWIATHKTK